MSGVLYTENVVMLGVERGQSDGGRRPWSIAGVAFTISSSRTTTLVRLRQVAFGAAMVPLRCRATLGEGVGRDCRTAH